MTGPTLWSLATNSEVGAVLFRLSTQVVSSTGQIYVTDASSITFSQFIFDQPTDITIKYFDVPSATQSADLSQPPWDTTYSYDNLDKSALSADFYDQVDSGGNTVTLSTPAFRDLLQDWANHNFFTGNTLVLYVYQLGAKCGSGDTCNIVTSNRPTIDIRYYEVCPSATPPPNSAIPPNAITSSTNAPVGDTLQVVCNSGFSGGVPESWFLNPSASDMFGGITMFLTRVPNAASFFDVSLYSFDVILESYPNPDAVATRVHVPFIIDTVRHGLVFNSTFSNNTGYHPVTVARYDRSTGNPVSTEVLRKHLLYVDHGCIRQGYVLYNGVCQVCPPGAHCPGGERMWPLPGWWSPSEFTKPTPCRIRAACPGAVGGGGLPPLINPDGTRRTAVCSSEYDGQFCAECAAAYFMDNGVCRSCGSDASANAELTVVLISLAAFIGTIAWGLATLSAKRVVLIVSTLVVLQQMAMVSRVGLQELSDSDTSPVVGGVVRFAAIINFEIETVRPGCSIPKISFPGLYYGTLVLLAGSLALFVIAAGAWRVLGRAASHVEALRSQTAAVGEDALSTGVAVVGAISAYAAVSGLDRDAAEASSDLDSSSLSSAEEQAEAAARHVSTAMLMQSRIVHATFILGSLAYLQIAVRTLQALYCVNTGDGTSRLAADLTIICYQGAHLGLAPLAWTVAVFFCAGFPLLGFVISLRLSRSADGLDRDVLIERYGITVLVREAGSRLLAAVLNFCLNIILVAAMDPFLNVYHTALSYAVGVLSCGQILYFIHRENREYFVIGLGVVCGSLAVAFCLAAWRFSRWRGKRVGPARHVASLDEVPLESKATQSESMSTVHDSDVSVADIPLSPTSPTRGGPLRSAFVTRSRANSDSSRLQRVPLSPVTTSTTATGRVFQTTTTASHGVALFKISTLLRVPFSLRARAEQRHAAMWPGP
ncbi:uncharacterized protein AMSG_06938 [Thecamonas trahens ATCC 50062]|uniref:Uncharacterized protein n=1 Tax=Thecamonas trahens ATCC 50062 TaxID=461836 RepID=A0A0L0DDQ5_THETB|nr:hypothetical protein AMSG_06938 [Thecamonas trahens ATCC 50062]KNC50439.1 hypothetical protein AMSG_06938 [Thecamonas trahens ATCC 50062]|eukprot:XP_013756978.1 hypothetical protein AMSG_06938 [Thecamonas trahens ATCC 50062]